MSMLFAAVSDCQDLRIPQGPPVGCFVCVQLRLPALPSLLSAASPLRARGGKQIPVVTTTAEVERPTRVYAIGVLMLEP